MGAFGLLRAGTRRAPDGSGCPQKCYSGCLQQVCQKRQEGKELSVVIVLESKRKETASSKVPNNLVSTAV